MFVLYFLRFIFIFQVSDLFGINLVWYKFFVHHKMSSDDDLFGDYDSGNESPPEPDDDEDDDDFGNEFWDN